MGVGVWELVGVGDGALEVRMTGYPAPQVVGEEPGRWW